MKNFMFTVVIFMIGLTMGMYIKGDNLTASTAFVGNREQVVQRREFSEWEVMKLALVWQESSFNPSALGKGKDTGILQITPVYVKEVNRLSGSNYTLQDAYDPVKSMEMFEIYQNYKNPEKNIEKAITLHNPRAGKRYLNSVLDRKAKLEKVLNSI